MNLMLSDLERVTKMLKTLAHPIRIHICNILAEHEMAVNDILIAKPMEQAVLSQHLTLMKRNGILSSRREGQKMIYRLQSTHVLDILNCMEKCINKTDK